MTPDRTPRVVLDATAIPAERGGVGRYVDGLVQGMQQIGQAGRLVVVAQVGDGGRFASLAPEAEIITAPALVGRTPVRLAWEQSGLPAVCRAVGADLLHGPHYTYPLAARCPVVVTVHDATFFSLPSVHLRSKRVFFRAWTRRSVLNADGLITDSRATRDEVLRLVGGDPATFTVAHLGVDHEVFRPPSKAEVSEFQRMLGTGGRAWIAFLGTLEPRKNVPALVRAYTQAFGDDREPPLLLLAGSPGWDDDVARAVSAVRAPLEVRRLGYLPRAMLAPFLGGSLLVAYPSLGEGFGLPVLEAMACGAPVLTTPRLSIPEVGGDAVAYVEPDVRSLAVELTALAGDEQRQTHLRAAAVARAATFTWARCAETHAESYARAAWSSR